MLLIVWSSFFFSDTDEMAVENSVGEFDQRLIEARLILTNFVATDQQQRVLLRVESEQCAVLMAREARAEFLHVRVFRTLYMVHLRATELRTRHFQQVRVLKDRNAVDRWQTVKPCLAFGREKDTPGHLVDHTL